MSHTIFTSHCWHTSQIRVLMTDNKTKKQKHGYRITALPRRRSDHHLEAGNNG